MYGKNAAKIKLLFLVAVIFLAGCQTVKDEVSVRSENIDFAVEETAAVVSKAPTGENPINAIKKTGIEPATLEIPAIGVESTVQHLGVTKKGEMAVPDNIEDVSWFEPGYRPGQNGRAVIAGHVDGIEGPAVFWDLSKLERGDEIFIEGGGERLKFQIKAMESIPLDMADIPSLFGYWAVPELVLITCSGVYNRKLGTREERLVVYASLVEEQ